MHWRCALLSIMPLVIVACDHATEPVEQQEPSLRLNEATASNAGTKELYVIGDKWYSPIHAYAISPVPPYLTYQRASPSPILWTGYDLTIDTDSETLFVAGGSTGKIAIVDAETLEPLGPQVPVPGLTPPLQGLGLAGITFDHKNQKLYTVVWQTDDLYVFSWNAATKTLSFDGHHDLPGHQAWPYMDVQFKTIDMDDVNGRLYGTLWGFGYVFYWDTADWTKPPQVVFVRDPRCQGYSVAVDVRGEYVYVGHYNRTSLSGFCQVDLETESTEFVLTPGNCTAPNDIAVDPETGLVYLTNVGGGGSCGATTREVLVYDPDLTLLHSVDLSPGYPTGLVVPGKDISPNAPPTADAGPDIRVLVTKPATFDGSGSFDPDGTIVAYDWDFGDGGIGTGKIAAHSFALAGEYTATLTVTDNGGLTASDVVAVMVLTPRQAVEDLADAVDALVASGDLTEQSAEGLHRKLTEAKDRIDAGNSRAASRKLHDFIDHVHALMQSGRLGSAAGQTLVDAAQDIIDVLSA